VHDGKRPSSVPVAGRFTLNSVGMIRRPATLDAGIVLTPELIVADELGPTGSCVGIVRQANACLRHYGNPATAGEDAAIHRVPA
jgi:hypothetical protein